MEFCKARGIILSPRRERDKQLLSADGYGRKQDPKKKGRTMSLLFSKVYMQVI